MKDLVKVTTRNFLKPKNVSFQYVSRVNGVPKGKNRPLFDVFTSNQIKQIKSLKIPFSQGKSAVFDVSSRCFEWTKKTGIGLRKSYEFKLKQSVHHLRDDSEIIYSGFHLRNLNLNQFFRSRGLSGREKQMV